MKILILILILLHDNFLNALKINEVCLKTANKCNEDYPFKCDEKYFVKNENTCDKLKSMINYGKFAGNEKIYKNLKFF